MCPRKGGWPRFLGPRGGLAPSSSLTPRAQRTMCRPGCSSAPRLGLAVNMPADQECFRVVGFMGYDAKSINIPAHARVLVLFRAKDGRQVGYTIRRC